MLRQIPLAAAIIISVEAIPVSASAQLCESILSWLCFKAEPTSKSAMEESPQKQMTATPRYTTDSPKKGANSARSRALQVAAPPDASINLPAGCLSREQVVGGYPRYRVIAGRHCWYASARGPQRKLAETNVNPSGPELGTTQLHDCEEQALKLYSEEKRAFLKQCMSNNRR